jgi:cytochrome b subunit of formate dehydrogenase
MDKARDDYLQRLNHAIVWLLAFLLILLAVTGYGITNPQVVDELTGGILTHPLSLYLHTLLDFPVFVLLMIHVLIGLRSALLRRGVKDGKMLSAFLLILGLYSVFLLVVMDPTIL